MFVVVAYVAADFRSGTIQRWHWKRSKKEAALGLEQQGLEAVAVNVRWREGKRMAGEEEWIVVGCAEVTAIDETD